MCAVGNDEWPPPGRLRTHITYRPISLIRFLADARLLAALLALGVWTVVGFLAAFGRCSIAANIKSLRS